MKRAFSDYLASIDITSSALRKKAEEALELATRAAPGKIRDIFVNDWIEEDGSRAYGDFECVAEGCLIAVLSFVTTPSKAQIAVVESSVSGVNMEFKNFDFKNAGNDSRLILQVNMGHEDGPWRYKASRGNCDKLWSFYEKYIKPNLAFVEHVAGDSA